MKQFRRLLALAACVSRLPVEAVDFPLIEQRGRVLMVIDPTLRSTLAPEIAQYQLDLQKDGWEVSQALGFRHIDCDRVDGRQELKQPEYKANQKLIKELIHSHWRQNTNVATVAVLVGHITVPYSGYGREDGHVDHLGAWSADSYYGDMSYHNDPDPQKGWTDTEEHNNAGSNGYFHNYVGDGKWDQNFLPKEPDGSFGKLEVAIGRIDFSSLDVFVGRSTADQAPTVAAVEIALMRKYFAKIHAYRMKQLQFTPGITETRNTSYLFVTMDWNITAAASAFGFGLDQIFHQDVFTAGTGRTLGFQADAGTPEAVGSHTSNLIASGAQKPNAAFVVLAGSYFADWQTWNPWGSPLLKCCLAAPNCALTVSWSLSFNSPAGSPLAFQSFAANQHYGKVMQDTYALGVTTLGEPNVQASTRTLFCLGDPTLHALVATPPTGLVTAVRTGATVSLQWDQTPGLTSHVYRCLGTSEGPAGPWLRLTSVPTNVGAFEDSTPSSSKWNWYQVRNIEQMTLGTRTGPVLSQAIMTSIQ